ncbi:MAG: sugar transferase [Anaerolineae bacterium]|nr:sugar transferase [Anaerolineae bacterium]
MKAQPEQNAQNNPTERSSSEAWSRSLLPLIRRPFSLFRLPLRVSERRLLLMALDLLAVNGALLLALAAPSEQGFGGALATLRPLGLLLLSLLWLALAQALDAYDLRVASRFSSAAQAVGKAALVATLIYAFVEFFWGTDMPLRGLALPLFPLLAIVLLLAGRGLYVLALFQPRFCRPTLIIGAGWAGQAIAQVLAEHGGSVYQVVGFVDDDPAKLGKGAWEHGGRSPEQSEGTGAGERRGGGAVENSPLPPGTPAPLLVLGDRHTLLQLIAEHRVTTLVLAITHEIHGELLQTLMDALEMGVEIIPMPVLYGQLTGKVPVEHVGDNWYVAMPLDHLGTSSWWPIVKRVMDVLLASLGLLFLVLALPVIAVAIALDSPGPIFYTQERVGKGGRVFRMYKFRSMVPDAERGEAVWAQADDPRVTRVGRILRKTHMDEFPQFLNILKGDMSAVGPRPERPELVEKLAAEIPFYRVRHAVRPGMAGWGLVKEGYGASREESLLKLQCDLYYIKHQSPWLDLEILLKTIIDAVSLRGR